MTDKHLRYLMIVNGENHWLNLYESGVLYENGQVSVQIGGRVMESNGKEREITDEERARIVEIADRVSENK